MITDTEDQERILRISTLNDNFRSTMIGGRIVITAGIQVMTDSQILEVMQKVQTYTTFSENNDPYSEHDFGSLICDGEAVFWKIDYYDKDCKYGSENPANPEMTTRVLTILLASEY